MKNLLIQKLKEDQLKARKDGDEISKNLLTTLISDINRVAKDDGNREPTNKDAISIIEKYVKNCNEISKVSDQGSNARRLAYEEKKILESYLGDKITGDKLRQYILSLIEEDPYNNKRNIGYVMKNLSQGSLYIDKKEAAQIARELIEELNKGDDHV